MMHIKLKKLREKHELTQQQLADALGFDRSTYAYYESGKCFPDIPTIIKLSELYSVSCDYLMKDNIIKQKNSVDEYDLLNKVRKEECELLCCFRMMPTNVQDEIMNSMKTIVKKINL